MTTSFDFDRVLRSVLEAEGPQTIDTHAVEAALTSARAIPQRRPLVRGLDRRAWPTGPVAATRSSSRRLVLIGAVGLLVVAFVAAIIVAGGSSRPSLDLLGDGARVTYSDEATLAFIDDSGLARQPNVVLGRGGVPTIVPGTNLATVSGFGTRQVIDRRSGSAVATVDTDYNGGERWSASGDHLALVDVSGVVTVVSFVDQASPTSTRYEIPGLQWMDFAWDGRRMVVAVLDGATLGVDVIDLETSERRRAHAIQLNSPLPDPSDGSDVGLVWASDAERVLLSTHMPDGTSAGLWIVSLDGAGADRVELASAYAFGSVVSSDGRWFSLYGDESVYVVDGTTRAASLLDAGPTTLTVVGWSSDGGRLATLEEGLLRVIDTDGTDPTTELTGVVSAEWVRDRHVLVVARTVGQSLSIDSVAGDGDEIRNLALIDDLQPTGLPVVTVDLQEEQP